MAQRRKKRSTAQHRENYPGWMWMLFGLAIGLSVAFAIYMKDRDEIPAAPQQVREPASMEADIAEPQPAARADASPAAETGKRRFDFYDMLPNFEVVIPEQEPDVRQDSGRKEIDEPGLYVLQAGSFAEFGDADRRRAQLALQGIESRIQKVTIDDKTYHRVRIGPTSDLEELNDIRNRLRAARIDALRIRLGE